MIVKNNLSSGQTLIEILAAFVLLTFLLSGMVVVGLYSLRNVQYAKNRSQATKLASQQMERVRVMRDTQGVKALPSCGAGLCFLDSSLQFVAITPTGVFGQSLQIGTPLANECPTPAGAVSVTIYKSTVEVSWDASLPTPQKVELQSCLSNWQ